jgi:hypothetical protein
MKRWVRRHRSRARRLEDGPVILLVLLYLVATAAVSWYDPRLLRGA